MDKYKQVHNFMEELDVEINDIENSASINLTGMIATLGPLVKKYENNLNDVKLFSDVQAYVNELKGYQDRKEDNRAPSPDSVVNDLTKIIVGFYETV